MTVVSDKTRLAALMPGKDRALLAAFLLDAGTDFAPNPFPSLTVGAARHTCTGLAFEYPILGIRSAGLTCLLAALTALPGTTRLTRCILKSAAHTCIVFLTDDEACVGSYLYAKAGVPLPVFAQRSSEPALAPAKRKARQPTVKQQLASRQLDLFSDVA